MLLQKSIQRWSNSQQRSTLPCNESVLHSAHHGVLAKAEKAFFWMILASPGSLLYPFQIFPSPEGRKFIRTQFRSRLYLLYLVVSQINQHKEWKHFHNNNMYWNSLLNNTQSLKTRLICKLDLKSFLGYFLFCFLLVSTRRNIEVKDSCYCNIV